MCPHTTLASLLARAQEKGLQYRHTDNINLWIKAMRNVGVPEVRVLSSHMPVRLEARL